MVKLLAESDKPSEKTDLGVSIHVYTDNGEIKGIWSNSPLGVSEYTTEGLWKPIAPKDPRITELQDYTLYKIDWANDNDFDEDGESKTLDLYAKGDLTEKYLKENAIFLRNPIKEEQ
jgi:hypothetical protein